MICNFKKRWGGTGLSLELEKLVVKAKKVRNQY